MNVAMRIATPEEICARYGARVASVKAYFTYGALKAIKDHVGTRRPETGAMGFGPFDRDGIDLVEFDHIGSSKASCAVYSPDVRWCEGRIRHHLDLADQKMRVCNCLIHSHPGDFGRPSPAVGPAEGDMGYAKAFLEMNPHLPTFLMPIVTGAGTANPTFYCWVVTREEPDVAQVADVVITDAENFPPRRFAREWEAQQAKAGTAIHQEEVTAPRPADLPEEPQPFPAPLTINRDEYLSRLAGVLSADFSKRHILLVGVGAGSTLALAIARHGPRKLTVVDPDGVEIQNLCRTAYGVSDIGLPKVRALARALAEAAPFVEVNALQDDICAMSEDELRIATEGVDLIIAATDHLPAQGKVNELAQALGVPAIFIDIHAGGRGGMVVFTLPGQNACYRCIAARRFETELTDGTAATALPGARASMVDIGFVDHVAMKLALAILDRGRDSAMGRFFERLDPVRNQVIVRTDPAYTWDEINLFDLMLADLPEDKRVGLQQEAFFALDSLWLRAERNLACPACGGRHDTP